MALQLRGQALGLLASLLLGLGLGLGYDILRPPRRHGGRVVGALLDVLFSLLAACACFIGAMGAENGRLGLWELAASLLGFLLYLYTLSPMILPVLSAGFELLCRLAARCKFFSEKCQVSAKKFFQNVRKCFIVKR